MKDIRTFFLAAAALSALACSPDGENIALFRAATASSSFDHNLTAQLLTDGLSCEAPAYIEVFTPAGEVGRVERENTINGDVMSRNVIESDSGWIKYVLHGYTVRADEATVLYQEALAGGRGGENVTVKVPVEMSGDTLAVNLSFPRVARWRVKEVDFTMNGQPVTGIRPEDHFTSAWMSASSEDEWVRVDLGSVRCFSKVCPGFIWEPRRVVAEVSKDGVRWRKLRAVSGGCFKGGRGRFVRLTMSGGTDGGGLYCMTELEVLGRAEKAAPAAAGEGFDGGAWKLLRSSLTSAPGEEISSAGFADGDWFPAVVPGTVLASFIKAGAVPDPDFGDNVANISESYFNSDFWYRKEFVLDGEAIARRDAGKRFFLDFDGINWKAQVYVNGQFAGDIAGAFKRGHFDVSSLMVDGVNALAVKVIYPAHPGCVKEKTARWTGYNGGEMGYDSPTFVSTIGWDWYTTVRGRNIGIWNDVRLVEKGAAEVSDPLVVSKVSPDGRASVTASVELDCTDGGPVEVSGHIGSIFFSKTVSSSGKVTFSPDEFPQLKDTPLELWWPNNYGAPTLHDASFVVKRGGETADSLHFMAGIREVTSTVENGALKLFVNGRRINATGGNWGISQQNLMYGKKEYDAAIDYHRQMHFTMIRNWVGQTADEEFYDACDRYGILIWQDFWLANPADGQDPLDEDMFLDNARDYVSRIRRHPSVCLYCGRNEGVPPVSLDKALGGSVVPGLHPGIPYISDSAAGVVSGHGPYNAKPVTDYFADQSGKLHSERGMPAVPPIESLRRMMPEEDIWPQSEMWGKHDFTTSGAQRATTYNKMLSDAFGEPASGEEYAALAQWINYDGYRGMFESQNSAGRNGLLLWMTHSCWPSLVFDTYDYYFEPTGAFFGCKAACEPLHIQYNPLSSKVEIVNNCCGDMNEMWAVVRVCGLSGEVLDETFAIVNAPDDSTVSSVEVVPPAGEEVWYLSLCLKSQSGFVFSNNFYMFGKEKGNLQAVRTLPAAKLEVLSEMQEDAFVVSLTNTSDVPALMVRLIVKDKSGREILPVGYSDNYFSLLPGEERTVGIWWDREAFPGDPVLDCIQIGDFAR